MAHADASSVVNESWRKSLELSKQSGDGLISVMTKGQETMTIVLSPNDRKHIQRALRNLESDRAIAMDFEESNPDNLRIVAYDLVKSLHVTLVHLTDKIEELRNCKDKNLSEIASLKEELDKIKKLFEGACLEARSAQLRAEHAEQVNDDKSRVKDESDKTKDKEIEELKKRNTALLERNTQLEKEVVELRRSAENGNFVTRKRVVEITQETTVSPPTPLIPPRASIFPFHADSLDNLSTAANFTQPKEEENPKAKKEEPVESQEMNENVQISVRDSMGEEVEGEEGTNGDVIPGTDGNSLEVENSLNDPADAPTDRMMQPSDVMDYGMEFNEEIAGNREESMAEADSRSQVAPSFEEVEGTEQSQMLDNDGQDITLDGSIDEEGEKEDAVDKAVHQKTDGSETVEKDKKRRSTRDARRPMNYADSTEDSDGETEPSVKKFRSDSAENYGNKSSQTATQKKQPSNKGVIQSGSKNKESKAPHVNDTELDCPECDYQSRSVIAWENHLRSVHRTTPALAGLSLLCICEHEFLSSSHINTCSIASFTVVRKNNGPIRRIEDRKTTPQCVLCDIYPKTAYGYMRHLRVHHESTLASEGIYVKCSCGEAFHSTRSHPNHSKKCNGRAFALHKLDEE